MYFILKEREGHKSSFLGSADSYKQIKGLASTAAKNNPNWDINIYRSETHLIETVRTSEIHYYSF